jgi:hypothetical protein
LSKLLDDLKRATQARRELEQTRAHSDGESASAKTANVTPPESREAAVLHATARSHPNATADWNAVQRARARAEAKTEVQWRDLRASVNATGTEASHPRLRSHSLMLGGWTAVILVTGVALGSLLRPQPEPAPAPATTPMRPITKPAEGPELRLRMDESLDRIAPHPAAGRG